MTPAEKMVAPAASRWTDGPGGLADCLADTLSRGKAIDLDETKNQAERFARQLGLYEATIAHAIDVLRVFAAAAPVLPRSRVISRISLPARSGHPALVIHRLDCRHEVASPLADALPDGTPVLCSGCATDCLCGGSGRLADAPCRCRLGDAGRSAP